MSDGAVTEGHLPDLRFLQSDKLVPEGILWVDNVEDMEQATNYIEECKVIGIDCEWKPNYEKGSQPNKVLPSIVKCVTCKVISIFRIM